MKKRFTALLALLLVASLLAACGQEAVTETPPAATAAAETTPAEEPSVTIGFANASMNNGFFVTISNTLESLCKENGYDYVMYDCDWDNELQISQMEDLVNLGVNVIFLAPADVDGTRAGLEAASAADIPVIVLDNPVNEEDNALVAYTVASDNYQAGVICAEMMMADFPDGAKIAVLNHSSNNAARDRVDGFRDTVEATENYEIVEELFGEGTIEDSIEPAEDILMAHPEVEVFMACNELSGMGARSRPPAGPARSRSIRSTPLLTAKSSSWTAASPARPLSRLSALLKRPLSLPADSSAVRLLPVKSSLSSASRSAPSLRLRQRASGSKQVKPVKCAASTAAHFTIRCQKAGSAHCLRGDSPRPPGKSNRRGSC